MRSDYPNLLKNFLLLIIIIIIIIMFLHYATLRHGIEYVHDRDVGPLEQESRRNKNSHKGHKNYIFPQINRSLIAK